MREGRLIVVGGSSQSGKTTEVQRRAAKEKRILAWDHKRQWWKLPGFKLVRLRDLRRELDAAGRGPVRIAVQPQPGDVKKQFQAWAAACWYWLEHHGAGVVVAEELPAVTSPGKAGDDWGRLLSQSLYLQPTIYAIATRWQEADKTAFGNATDILCFQQARALDREYMARELDVSSDELAALPDFCYYHRDLRARTCERMGPGPRKNPVRKTPKR